MARQHVGGPVGVRAVRRWLHGSAERGIARWCRMTAYTLGRHEGSRNDRAHITHLFPRLLSKRLALPLRLALQLRLALLVVHRFVRFVSGCVDFVRSRGGKNLSCMDHGRSLRSVPMSGAEHRRKALDAFVETYPVDDVIGAEKWRIFGPRLFCCGFPQS